MSTKNNFILEFKYGFATEVKKLRLESGLSIEELAENIKVNSSQIYALELENHKDWDTLFKIMRFLKKKIKIEFC